MLKNLTAATTASTVKRGHRHQGIQLSLQLVYAAVLM